MNRQLAEAAPAKAVMLLKHQCHRQGKTVAEVNGRFNTRQCMQCASRDTKVTRTNVRCRSCGQTTPRDVNAAANAVLKHLANGGVASPRGHNREVTVRRRSALAAQCPVVRESLGLVQRALASWGPSKTPNPAKTNRGEQSEDGCAHASMRTTRRKLRESSQMWMNAASCATAGVKWSVIGQFENVAAQGGWRACRSPTGGEEDSESKRYRRRCQEVTCTSTTAVFVALSERR